ncbi:cutinase transcription factor 1 beta [Thelonectria olida]|uniref:Cutinase transcription factor 1 beta n=1 Tax=Thelonectria olida TaxID=1576542 RepID=A0A9P9AKC9_9HYPO|nr:cutinase transcription factor 1 beta [Thelonectria olida]
MCDVNNIRDPIQSTLVPDDIDYLLATGALILPTISLEKALLHAYVNYVHPSMPLLDLHHFLVVLDRRNSSLGHISLLLYQAVMFAATAFVDGEALHEAGYPIRKKARKDYFQKARLLYEFDYDLLLMTYWQEAPNEQKDMWHWLGLQHDPSNMGLPIREQNLRKRIWWCCVMRDRLIALGMRLSTQIGNEEFDVRMLQESDFEFATSPEDNVTIPAEYTYLLDTARQQELAALCISKAQLCIHIGSMLLAQYSLLRPNQAQAEATADINMRLYPRHLSDDWKSFQLVDAALLLWFRSLPLACQYRPLHSLTAKDGMGVVAVHRTLLHMLYHATTAALHRPRLLRVSSTHAPMMSSQTQEQSRLRARDAALHITQMAVELCASDLDKYLPNAGVAVVMLAMAISLLEIKNHDQRVHDQGRSCFYTCLHILDRLRQIHPSADWATTFFKAALGKVEIDMETRLGTMIQRNHQSFGSVVNPILQVRADERPVNIIPTSKTHPAVFHESMVPNMLAPQPAKDLALDTEVTALHTAQVYEETGSLGLEVFEYGDIDWGVFMSLELDSYSQ